MKNIIIAGPSRAGKSTLARKLNEELNCFIIGLDKLVTKYGFTIYDTSNDRERVLDSIVEAIKSNEV